MGRRKVGSWYARVERDRCIGRGGTKWTNLNSRGVHALGGPKKKHSVERWESSRRSRDAARMTVPGVNVASSIEPGEEE